MSRPLLFHANTSYLLGFGSAFKTSLDPISGGSASFKDLVGSAEVAPIVAHRFHLRAGVCGGKRIEESLNEPGG